MSLLKKFFKPRWQSKDASVRRAAVMSEDSADLVAALPRIARDVEGLAGDRRLDDRSRGARCAGLPTRHCTVVTDRTPAAELPLAIATDNAIQMRSGWKRYVFPGIWLVYLVQTLVGAHRHSDGLLTIVGYVLVVIFAAGYLTAFSLMWGALRHPLYYAILSGLVLICAGETFIAQDDAFVMCTFIAVLVLGAHQRWSIPAVIALIAITLFLPPLIPAWHEGIGWGNGFALVMVSFAMWGFFAIIASNRALSAARSEVARLAAENERTRIARDLHDLLGHSLTTITVKAGLARRLAEIDPARAAAEIAEVEQLGRRSLVEVRAAVSGYREVSLVGELASARQVLQAAGIRPILPGAIDSVPPDRTELFGWAVREGVTNTVRHSRATSCTVELGPCWVEIRDDGHPMTTGGPGNGLLGLQERVDEVGGTLTSGPIRGVGWRTRVEVPA